MSTTLYNGRMMVTRASCSLQHALGHQQRAMSILSKYSWYPHYAQQKKETQPKQPQQWGEKKATEPLPTLQVPIKPVESEAARMVIRKPPVQPENPKSLTIAMLGAPNAGKSTLVNFLIGNKVAAVSPKSQTTRDGILGVLTKDNTQLLFFDTPGVVPPEDQKQIVREIITSSWNVVEQSDIVCFIVDGAKRLDENVTHIIRQLETNLAEVRGSLKLDPVETLKSKKCILVVNKIDLVKPKDKLLPVISKLNEGGLFAETFLTSALKGLRVDPLKITDFSPLQHAEEIIREKIYQRLNQEVPYVVRQHNVGWTELPDGSLRIDQYLIVPKLAQKWMITGAKSKVIRAIANDATEDLQKIFNKKVYINLQVQHKKQIHEYTPS